MIGYPTDMTDRSSFTCILITLGISLALPIAELVIGDRHLDDTVCANGRLMRPAVWLVATGAITLTSIVLGAFLLISAALQSDDLARVALFMLRTFSAAFSIAWTIIGMVVLWRDNADCPAGELHDMIWASVIIHLVSMLVLLIGSKE